LRHVCRDVPGGAKVTAPGPSPKPTSVAARRVLNNPVGWAGGSDRRSGKAEEFQVAVFYLGRRQRRRAGIWPLDRRMGLFSALLD
jgi:hypothetical protein